MQAWRFYLSYSNGFWIVTICINYTTNISHPQDFSTVYIAFLLQFCSWHFLLLRKFCSLQHHRHIWWNTNNSIFDNQISRMNNVTLPDSVPVFFSNIIQCCCFILLSWFHFNRLHLVFQFAVIRDNKIDFHIISVLIFIVMRIEIQLMSICNQHLCYGIFIKQDRGWFKDHTLSYYEVHFWNAFLLSAWLPSYHMEKHRLQTRRAFYPLTDLYFSLWIVILRCRKRKHRRPK